MKYLAVISVGRVLLAGVTFAALACRSHAPSTPVTALQGERVPGRAAYGGNADAAVDVAPSDAAPDVMPDATSAERSDLARELARMCGNEMPRIENLRPLDRALFPREQREATAPRGWRLPAVLAWAPPDPRSEDAMARTETKIVLGPSNGEPCSVLTGSLQGSTEAPTVHGPFAGVEGSNVGWTAGVFCGSRMLVGLFDERGVPRLLRDSGDASVREQAWSILVSKQHEEHLVEITNDSDAPRFGARHKPLRDPTTCATLLR
jgi:hypothetical protein